MKTAIEMAEEMYDGIKQFDSRTASVVYIRQMLLSFAEELLDEVRALKEKK